MPKRLTRKFFTQPTLDLGKKLLGKIIVRKVAKKKFCGKIVEVEVYLGPNDRASHAYLPHYLRQEINQGKITERNKVEYLIGGHIYIYLVYGMYWQFNIVTGREGSPECILIRAIEPIIANQHPPRLAVFGEAGKFTTNNTNNISDIRAQISENSRFTTDGPGKLCRWLKLDKSFNGEDLTKSKRIWLEDPAPERAQCGASRGEIKKPQIVATKRIGIDYAGKYWANKRWRFYVKDNPFVSKK